MAVLPRIAAAPFFAIAVSATVLAQPARPIRYEIKKNTVAIVAEATYTLTDSGPAKPSTWSLFAQMPVNGPDQSLIQVLLVDGKEVPLGTYSDLSPFKRQFNEAIIRREARSPRTFTVTIRYKGTVSQRSLVPLPRGKVAPETDIKLAETEKRLYLSADATCDFVRSANEGWQVNPGFAQWMTDKDLWKHDGEDSLSYGRRVAEKIKRLFPYGEHAGKEILSDLYRSPNLKCGGASIVAVSVLRANGEYARLVNGIAANELASGPLEQYRHTLGEQFVPGIGWVPFDIASGGDRPYGWDPGLVRLQIDCDVVAPPGKASGKYLTVLSVSASIQAGIRNDTWTIKYDSTAPAPVNAKNDE